MRRCWAAVLVLAASCGRVGFDSRALGDGGPDMSDIDASSDASTPLTISYIKASNTETFDSFGYAIALSGDGATLAVTAPQEDCDGVGVAAVQTNNGRPQSGAVYIYVRSGATWVQQVYLKPSNPDSQDLFGWTVALSHDGNTLVVGSPLEDSDAIGVNQVETNVSATFDSGAAYVFSRTGTTWTQQAYLKASNTQGGDDFGVDVAVSGDGNTIAIGAGLEDSAAVGIDQDQTSNAAPDSGAVYVFTRAGVVWSQQAYIKASNTEMDDVFGNSLALSFTGSTLAVAAKNEDSGTTTINGDETDNGVTEAGAVYIFERTTGVWAQQAYVKPSTAGFGDFFGLSISLDGDGNTLACGTPGQDETVPNSGTVYLFTRTATVWTEALRLKTPNVGDDDQFGVDVALAGTGQAVGASAPLEDSAATGLGGDQGNEAMMDSGALYLFPRGAGQWPFTTYIKGFAPTAGDQFGNAIAMSFDGMTIAVALWREDSAATGIDNDASDESAMDSGAVYILSM